MDSLNRIDKRINIGIQIAYISQIYLENAVRYLVFCITFVGFICFGCSGNFVEMKYNSALMQEYRFNTNAPLIVAPHKGDVLAASYIPFVIELLQKRGFSSVYTESEIPLSQARNIIYISLVKATNTIPTSSITYLPMQVLDKNSCFNYDGIYYCRQETYPIITGYSASLNLTSNYHFIMDWYDLPMKKRILYVDGTIQDGPCIYDGIYKDLIYQTIAKINFNRPEVYSYKTLLSYSSFGCMFERTKSLTTRR
ncbi:hypothetical protein HFN_1129 [Helicobacter fennelliae MRY12-0050]|uniref:Uncharacterized protein n=1 Tax=Helicobacter fennelliae MRY12-0050 TaxID=1325130 RepID=T1CSS7_9HELI|nr:hypothetical protein HFN_1129 [Helicobacter fennelliae MRY12-0050]